MGEGLQPGNSKYKGKNKQKQEQMRGFFAALRMTKS
jgi:hypothetical protein